MRRKRRAILPALVMVGVLLYVAREPILQAVGDYLVIQDNLEPADVIHVIAGGDDRTDYAIRLYKQGYGQRLFFTGGWCTDHDYFHGQHGIERAEAQEVPAAVLAADDSVVTSTYAEAELLKRLIAASSPPVRSVIVVSDPFHMRRARWTYRCVLGRDIRVEMAPVPFGVTRYQRQWWTDDLSRAFVKQEYPKLIYYFLRYQLRIAPLSDWLASLDQD